VKIIATVFCLLISAASAQAQDILSKLQQIEQNNANLAARLAVVENKIDGLAAKLDDHMAKITAKVSQDIGPIALPNIPQGSYQARMAGDWIPIPGATLNVPVNVPAGNYWLRANTTAYASGNGVVCGPNGCTTSSYPYGYTYSYPAGYSYQAYQTYGVVSSGTAGKCGLFSRLRSRRAGGCQ
jgi:hypothetical protein